MSWPTNPTNGQTATINGIVYVYNSAKNAWGPAAVTSVTSIVYTGNVTAGNINVTGNLSLTGTINYNANGVTPKSYTDVMAIVFGF
jgi:hypothetical protein